MQITRKQVEDALLKLGRLQGVKTDMSEYVGLNITEFFQRVGASTSSTTVMAESVMHYINGEQQRSYPWLRERFVNIAVNCAFKAHGDANWGIAEYKRRRVLTMISYMIMSELGLNLVEVAKTRGQSLNDLQWIKDDLKEIGAFQYIWGTTSSRSACVYAHNS